MIFQSEESQQMIEHNWEYWQHRLAGQSVQMNPSNPQPGFYRMPRKEFYGARKTYTPVAYWPGANGQINCRVGDEDVSTEKGQSIWERVGAHPVSEEAYREVAERGGLWPDEHELVPMGKGHNRPPEPQTFEELRDAIEDLAREAGVRCEGEPIANQDEADKIANLSDRLTELWKKADEARKEEKKPYDEGAIKVQKRWAPLLLQAETYKLLKSKLLTPWLRYIDQLKKKEAEEAAAAGEAAEPQRARAGTRGRATGLRTHKRAQIEDYRTCLNFFAESPDVKATVQDLANRAVRAGITVPGAKLIEESAAV